MERPLNDIRKLITANLDIVSAELEDIKKHPLVISISPSNEPCIKFLGKFNNIHNLLIAISKKMLLFIMLINTENIITKPPIDNVVLIELSILSFKTNPIFFFDLIEFIFGVEGLNFLQGIIRDINIQEIILEIKIK